MAALAELADLIVAELRRTGTQALFGVPGGGGNLDLIEAARKAGLPFVLTSTETGAAVAATAQAEILQRPGACLTTLGPGVASVVNGIACACLERAPLMLFTDSHPLSANGRFAHQQIDHVALLKPITKWSARLSSINANETVQQAFHALTTLPPGPVHLDCPGDVTGKVEAARALPSGPAIAVDPQEAKRFDELVSGARKPLVLIGLGARRPGGAAAIRELCERRSVPAMVTYKGKGALPDAHPCFAGVFTNGSVERAIVGESDLLIGLGLDPVELLPRPWTFPQAVVGLNEWRLPAEHVPFAAQSIGNLTGQIRRLEATIRGTEWDLETVATLAAGQRFTDTGGGGMGAQHVVDVAASALAGAWRATVDAGAHMLPVMMRWPAARPDDLLISNGLSTMGFALPAAIGAAIADRQRPVVALTGDGGLLICIGELLTAVRERLRLIVIVFSDTSLSLIEIKQQARQLPAAGVALGPMNWAALAESFGARGFSARSEPELAMAIEQAAAHDGVSVIEAKIDRSNYGRMLKAIRG
ncbi:MAG TPA: thiamine pyrophosphate-binding protein [Vicinamibacterales bacterium]|nr:thiamine pyrophosphate-binding protein [Vicinamibacterales bacterium]